MSKHGPGTDAYVAPRDHCRAIRSEEVRICFDLGGVFYPGAPDEDNALALKALLESLIYINRVYLRRMKTLGVKVPSLYQSGVRYTRTTVWDSIPDLLARRYGDCKSLTAMRVAEIREAEGDGAAQPVFRFMPRGARKDFHILVQHNGQYEDPSRKLGMTSYYASMGQAVYPQ